LGASLRVFATTDSASLSTEVAFHRQLVVQKDPDSVQTHSQPKQLRKGKGDKPELWHLEGFRGRARARGNFSAGLLHVVDGLHADSRCQFVSKVKKNARPHAVDLNLASHAPQELQAWVWISRRTFFRAQRARWASVTRWVLGAASVGENERCS
jgi:hypothetical protein